VRLGFELTASHLQSWCSTTQDIPPIHFALVILEMDSTQTICLGQPLTVILLISASQVARLVDMSHQLHPAILVLRNHHTDLHSGFTNLHSHNRLSVLFPSPYHQ
jgi:hypothetical protein